MKNKIGVMQGRLVPKFQERYQAFPIGMWQILANTRVHYHEYFQLPQVILIALLCRLRVGGQHSRVE
jgi:hypothetical protein